jgi:cell wall-associated NlpC family hydrolase
VQRGGKNGAPIVKPVTPQMKAKAKTLAKLYFWGKWEEDKKGNVTYTTEPLHYTEAYTQLLAAGIDPATAEQALNTYWTRPGYDYDIENRKQGKQIPYQTNQGRPLRPYHTPGKGGGGPRVAGVGVDLDAEAAQDPAVAKVLGLAQQYLGQPYKWGGSNPKSGFDCSGFIQWLYAQQGIKIPRTTYQQIKAGKAVSIMQVEPGDAIFFGSKADPHHVGLYIGNGWFIHSPHTGDVIKVSKLGGYDLPVVDIRRYA